MLLFDALIWTPFGEAVRDRQKETWLEGAVTNADSVSLILDDAGAVRSLGTTDLSENFNEGGSQSWEKSLMLDAGSYEVKAQSEHPSGKQSELATYSFEVGQGDCISTTYDPSGYVISRNFYDGREQLFHWDAAGRLISIEQRDENTAANNLEWLMVYDGFGRRIRSYYLPTSDNTTDSYELDHYYDPQVEFLEVAVALNGEWTWKIYGLDSNGAYGGLQGIGGLFMTVNEGTGEAHGYINDILGHVVGYTSLDVDSGKHDLTWNSEINVSGYGPLPGQAQPKHFGYGENGTSDLAESVLWQGRHIDPTGYYWMGSRYYDYTSGRFLSPDPLGHEASMDLYSYANGDPINYVDPTGRFESAAMRLSFDSNAYGDGKAAKEFVDKTILAANEFNPINPNSTLRLTFGSGAEYYNGVVASSLGYNDIANEFFSNAQELSVAGQVLNSHGSLEQAQWAAGILWGTTVAAGVIVAPQVLSSLSANAAIMQTNLNGIINKSLHELALLETGSSVNATISNAAKIWVAGESLLGLLDGFQGNTLTPSLSYRNFYNPADTAYSLFNVVGWSLKQGLDFLNEAKEKFSESREMYKNLSTLMSDPYSEVFSIESDPTGKYAKPKI